MERHRSTRTLGVVAGLAAIIFLATACPPPPGGGGPGVLATGSFDYEVLDAGVVVESGGGPVEYALNEITGAGLYDCSLVGAPCDEEWAGTMTTLAGFAGETGVWTTSVGWTFGCLSIPCGSSATTSVGLTTSPGGAYSFEPGRDDVVLIDGTDGCPSRGIKFEDATGSLDQDPTLQVSADIVICSPGLHGSFANALALPG